MVLVIHDFSNKIIRFERDNKIILRGKAHDFTETDTIKILNQYVKNINSIWDVRLWRLIQLYHMFIEKIGDKIDFNNGIATDSKNKIKYILVMDMNFELDNNYSCILLLYAPYGLSSVLEDRIIKSDITIHFIST